MKYFALLIFTILIFAASCSEKDPKKGIEAESFCEGGSLSGKIVPTFNRTSTDSGGFMRLIYLNQENLQFSRGDSQIRIWSQVPLIDSGSITNIYKKNRKWFIDNTVFGFRPCLNDFSKLILSIKTQSEEILENKSNILKLIDSLSMFNISKPAGLDMGGCNEGGFYALEFKTGLEYNSFGFPICGKNDLSFREIKEIMLLLDSVKKEFGFSISSPL